MSSFIQAMTALGIANKGPCDGIEDFAGKRSLLFGDQDKGRLHLRRPHLAQADIFSMLNMKPYSNLLVLI